MKKNYIEESILISSFAIISLKVYEAYRLTYFVNEPLFNPQLLIFPLIIIIAFLIIVSNKKD